MSRKPIRDKTLDDLERQARRIQGMCFQVKKEGGFIWCDDMPTPTRQYLMSLSGLILRTVEQIRKENKCE